MSSVLAALRWACQDETQRHASVMKTMPATKLEQVWTLYNVSQRSQCTDFAGLDRAPSYVELLTCLEIAKQADELPEESKSGTVGGR